MGISIEPLLAGLVLASTTVGAAAPSVKHGTIQLDGPSGNVRLVANGTPVKFEVDGLCRYDPGSNQWSREAFAPINMTVGAGVVAELPGRVGLYWVQWKEDGRRFSSMAVSGPVLCNDIALAPSSQSGVIAACIPLQDSARAGYVPDPRLHCGQ